MTGLGLELYEPEPVSFSQDSQGFFLTVKIIQIQCCYFAGPGRGIIEQMKQGIIPEPLFSFEINGLKDLQDLILIKKAD
jgi:sulfur relay (sulfurtransferase) complex TusBCD TusD component (DsrE family)